MGQQPAKMFLPPTPYGQSPDSNVLMQAQAPPQAPKQNFIPLNQAEPSAQTPVQTSAAPGMVGRLDRPNGFYGGFGPGRRIGGLFE